MVTVEFLNGKLYVSDRFSYTRQVGDIGDVSTSNANFTNSFNVRRDKVAIKSLDGLSLPSSNSTIPYRRVNSLVKINGIDVIDDGWIQIKEANKSNFKISVLDGNVDFWKAIEGVSLSDIDLSETEHTKNMSTVIDSFTNPYYKYILADYGGETFPDIDTYNIDHLPPAIAEDYIFRRIFKFIGMSYIMPISIDTWLTYPKSATADLGFDGPMIMGITVNDLSRYERVYGGRPFTRQAGRVISNASDFAMAGIYDFKIGGVYILKSGFYEIDITENVTAIYTLERQASGEYINLTLPVHVYININGQRYSGNINNIELDVGDVLGIDYVALSDSELNMEGYDIYDVGDLDRNSLSWEINKYIFEDIDFGDALKSIKATDFIKYIMHRYGLTLFYKDNQVDFRTVDQRLEADSIDYSEWFKERDSERYTYSNYAQQNRLAHKYVDDDKGFNDGVIFVNNQNLPEERTLLESFTYSPTRNDELIIFETKAKEVDGEIELEYKGIDRNFSINFIMKNKTLNLNSTIQDITGQAHTGSVPVLDLVGTTFREYKNLYWLGMERLLNNSKLHSVTFKMSIYEFLHIDLKKKLYLRQEASEYIINSAKIKGNQEVVMELIKLD